MQCIVSLFLVISTNGVDCLERHVSYYLSSGSLNPAHSLTYFVNVRVFML